MTEWLSGQPVLEFEPGRFYLVEFWASWCGNCIGEMQHLSELQERYGAAGLTVVSMTSMDADNPREDILAFVAQHASDVPFPLGLDASGDAWKVYMQASGQAGLPAAFLVDRTGRIADISHPSDMVIPIARLAAGTWDPVEGPKDIKAMRTERNRISIRARSVKADKAEDLLNQIEAFVERWPEVASDVQAERYAPLLAAGRLAQAGQLGRELVQDAIDRRDTGFLYQFAQAIVDEKARLAHQDLSLALWAAEVAVILDEKQNAFLLDTLARTHFLIGGLDRAIDLQRRAVDIAKADDGYGIMAFGFQKRLKEYQALLDPKTLNMGD